MTMCTSLTFLLMTTITDPGIIPRNYKTHQERVMRERVLQQNKRNDIEIGLIDSQNGDAQSDSVESRQFVAVVDGKEITVGKCRTCHIYRPPRSFHCSDCQACIEVHDHHCPWVGTCVGKRNHKFFFLFVSATLIHSIATVALDALYLISKEVYADDDKSGDSD